MQCRLSSYLSSIRFKMRYRSASVAGRMEKIGMVVVISLFTYLLYSASSSHLYLEFNESDDPLQPLSLMTGPPVSHLRTHLKQEVLLQEAAKDGNDLANDQSNVKLEDTLSFEMLQSPGKVALVGSEPLAAGILPEAVEFQPHAAAVEPEVAMVISDAAKVPPNTQPEVLNDKLVSEQLPAAAERAVVAGGESLVGNTVQAPLVVAVGQQVASVETSPNKSSDYKTIHFWVNVYGNDLVKQFGPDTRRAFEGCPVKTCQLTNEPNQFDSAHAVFIDIRHMLAKQVGLPVRRSWDQIWIFFDIEPPTYFPQSEDNRRLLDGAFNATLSYSLDATIPYPYVRPYQRSKSRSSDITRNYAAGRSKLLLWIVSNCGSRSQRELYAQELARYIPVDVVGRCAQLFKWNQLYNKTSCDGEKRADCIDTMGQNYKFYFASENSICPEYVTEKLSKALDSDMVPIVLGGADYKQYLPPKSYIDVRDFASPAELAKYLRLLDQHDALYNEYFQWKGEWQKSSGVEYLCLICSYLHSSPRKQILESVRDWYSQDTCTTPAKYFHGHNGNITFLDNHHAGAI